jgi:antitoxin CcdA
MRMKGICMRVSDVSRSYAAQASPKQRLNLTVDASLVEAAKGHGFNLSALMEEKITEVLQTERAKSWAEENREAIDQYNEMIDTEGLWSDGFRQF